jgi:two-component sensor histidine kinase
MSTHSELAFQVSPSYADAPLGDQQTQIDELTTELQTSHAREEALLGEKLELLREKLELQQRQVILAQEFEHRLVNGLQVIVSLLSMQSRAASTDEAAEQLAAAADRVAALGRVHHRLHLLDFEDHVQIDEYLRHLCDDLSGLLCNGGAIVFEGASAVIPSAIAIPLGLIVNELITNSAKHGNADITVRLESMSPASHALTVLDGGPGLPEGFDPTSSRGLGMRILKGLVTQIGGALHLRPYPGWPGTRITIEFCASSGSSSQSAAEG